MEAFGKLDQISVVIWKVKKSNSLYKLQEVAVNIL